jgi:hypothetical protein
VSAFVGELDRSGINTRSAFENMLRAAVRQFTNKDLPTGCMISLSGLHVPPGLRFLRDMMTEQRRKSQDLMEVRIRRGVSEGDVPSDTNVKALAAFYSAVSRGLVVLARDGASRKRLLEVVEIAMAAWPSSTSSKTQSP